MPARSARALVVELVADVGEFVKGTQKANTALGDFVTDTESGVRDINKATDKLDDNIKDPFEKVGTSARDAAEDAERHFDNLAREAKASFRKIETAAQDAGHETSGHFGEAGRESGGEFASNLSETLSSGDFTALGTDTAAGLVAGFAQMPGLGPALAVLAGGAALIFGSIVKEAERRAAQVSAAFERAATSAFESLDLTERGSAFHTFIEQLGGGDVGKGMREFNKQAQAAGVNVTDIKEAFIQGGTPLQNMVNKLREAESQGTKIVGNARTGRIEADGHARAAGGLALKLEQANTDLSKGVTLAGKLNSKITSADAAAAVRERSTHLNNQAADLNSQAESQRRINAALTNPTVAAAIAERTRQLASQESQAARTAAAVRGIPGTVVGGKSRLDMAAFSDNFNRANGPLAAPWVTPFAAADIVSNVLVLAGGVAVIDTGEASGTVQFTYAAGAPPRMGLRYTDLNNQVRWSSGTGLQAFVGGSALTTIAISYVFVIGDVLKVRITGTTYEAYVNGALKGSGTITQHATVTTFAAISPGSSTSIDDFSFTPLVPPGPTLTAVPDYAAGAIKLTVTGATGSITVTRYVQGLSPTGTPVRGSFANGRTVFDYDAPLNTDLVYIAKDTLGQSPQVATRLDSSLALLSSMSSPAGAIAVTVLKDRDQNYAGQSVAHKVLGTNAPLVSVEPMAFRAGTYEMLCPTVSDFLALRQALLPGGVMLLRSPCQTEFLDTSFIVTEQGWGPELSWNAAPPRQRVVSIGYQAVAPDTTPPTDIAWTWADVGTVFPTWADVPLAVATWGDLVTYIPAPP